MSSPIRRCEDERHPSGATTFRFDASDLMPGGVGAGSFWTGMVDYTGGKPAEEVAGNPEVLGCAEVIRRSIAH
jgi:hypothetical protein